MPDPDSAIRTTPISVEEAVGRLADDALVGLLVDLWDRQGWDVVEHRRDDPRYEDLFVARDWPDERRGLIRILRPSLDRTLGGDDIQQFLGPLQRSEVDLGHLVTTGPIPETVRRHAQQFDVTVVDRSALATRIERLVAYDLIGSRVEPPVASQPELLVSRLVTGAVAVLNRSRWGAVLRRRLGRRFPDDPDGGAVARFAFLGFRLGYLLSAGLFGLMLAADTHGLVFQLLLTAFLLVVYAGLLPAQAIDIVLLRDTEHRDWLPSWWYLAPYLLVPMPLLTGAHYWYRRRRPPGHAD